MNIPPFFNAKFVDDSGFLTTSQQLFLDNLINEMQISLGDNGIEVPQQTTVNINEIAVAEPNRTLLLHDIDTNELKVIRNGVVGVITVV